MWHDVFILVSILFFYMSISFHSWMLSNESIPGKRRSVFYVFQYQICDQYSVLFTALISCTYVGLYGSGLLNFGSYMCMLTPCASTIPTLLCIYNGDYCLCACVCVRVG